MGVAHWLISRGGGHHLCERTPIFNARVGVLRTQRHTEGAHKKLGRRQAGPNISVCLSFVGRSELLANRGLFERSCIIGNWTLEPDLQVALVLEAQKFDAVIRGSPVMLYC